MKILTSLDPQMKLIAYLSYGLLGISIVDFVDISIRMVAGTLGILLTLYLIQKTRSGIAVDKLTKQIKEQELQELLNRTKPKDNTNHQ